MIRFDFYMILLWFSLIVCKEDKDCKCYHVDENNGRVKKFKGKCDKTAQIYPKCVCDCRK